MWDIILKLLKFEAPCTFHEVTGLYCPGCGATRAARFLIRGNIKESFIFNPIVLYVCIATFIFLIFVVKYRISGRVLNKDRVILPMLYIGIFILLLNWIIKDSFLLFAGIDLLR
jgi:hypothetical protein